MAHKVPGPRCQMETEPVTTPRWPWPIFAGIVDIYAARFLASRLRRFLSLGFSLTFSRADDAFMAFNMRTRAFLSFSLRLHDIVALYKR